MNVLWLWPLPLIALVVYVWHETVAYRRETRSEHPQLEEHVARVALGYEARPDHPWIEALNNTRPSGSQAEDGARTERMFDNGNSS